MDRTQTRSVALELLREVAKMGETLSAIYQDLNRAVVDAFEGLDDVEMGAEE